MRNNLFGRKGVAVGGRKAVAVSEIFLLVSFSFAVAFIFGEIEVVSGQNSPIRDPPNIPAPTSQEIGTYYPPVGGAALTKSSVAPPTPANLPVNPNALASAPGSLKALAPSTISVGGSTFNSVPTYFIEGSQYANIEGVGPVVLKDGAWSTTSNLPGGYENMPAFKATAENVAGSTGTTNVAGQGQLGGLFSGTYFGPTVGSAITSGLVWGALVGGIAYGAAKFFGLNDKSAAGVGLGVGVGTAVGSTLYFIGQNGITAGTYTAGQVPFIFSPLGSILVGGAIAGGIIYATYTKEKKELVKFECLPWEPPTGGSKCEECNNDELPCSEYRCKSLGQACEIVNPGTLEEKCIWVGKGDATAPTITPWDEPLPAGLKYIPDRAISPPNRGFKIVDEVGDECLPAFLNFEFGVLADEPAQCKIGFSATNNYENSTNDYFGGNNLFLEEHSQVLKVPTPFAEDESDNDLTIGSDGTYQMWVRCIDANGNHHDAPETVFSFCVDDGPDVTQPQIVGTIINDGEPVAFGINEVPGFEIYVNEPAECKWSRQDKEYEFMENEMSCATETYQINAQLNYVCETTLTGIVDSEVNNFFFRCEDLSEAEGGRNKMESSYAFSLRGTEKLTIKDVGPSEDQTGSSDVVIVNLTVETAHGENNGRSTCYYSDVADEFSVEMDGEGTHVHNQQIDLTAGDYTYYYRCIDNGGNVAESNTTFSVIVDREEPKITRVFRDGNQLKVITDEDAQCFYSLSNCNYNVEDAASAFSYVDPRARDVHVADWDESRTYYVKCSDFRDRQPDPDECQLVVKASEL